MLITYSIIKITDGEIASKEEVLDKNLMFPDALAKWEIEKNKVEDKKTTRVVMRKE